MCNCSALLLPLAVKPAPKNTRLQTVLWAIVWYLPNYLQRRVVKYL